MIIATLSLIATILLTLHLASVLIYLHRLRPRRPSEGVIGQPAVTLLRPVCGLDRFDEETLRSSFTQNYPRYEILFCAPRGDDPVIGLIERLMSEHPLVPARLLIGESAISRNPKLNNLWKGWNAARHDWICMADSNLLLPRSYLSTLVASWGPATALVSAPPVGIRPQGLAGHLECAFLNSNQARLQGAAASLGFGFAQGKTLFWNRPLLQRAGGLQALGAFLAEDVSATKLARDLGMEVTLTPLPFAQPIGKRSLRQVWDRQLRWSRVRRDGFPILFAAELLNGALLPSLCAAAALLMSGAPLETLLVLPGLWYLGELALMRRAGWPAGLRDMAVLPLRDLLLPALWVATFLRRGFEWRGTPMGSPSADTLPRLAPHPAE
jgi:ceramide glucosyltransferase